MAPIHPQFSESIIHCIADYIRQGARPADAATFAGISHRTLTSWRKRGAKGEEPYTAAYELCKRAEADLKTELVGRMLHLARGHSDDNPLYSIREQQQQTKDGGIVTLIKKDYGGMDRHALAWLLERKWPDEFGKFTRQDTKVEVSGPGGSEPKFKVVIVDPKAEGS